MSDTAAYLVDRLLPEAPYRQWVLTVPWVLRYRLSVDRALLSRVLDGFLRTLFAWQRRRGRKQGMEDGRTGAETFVQRFGGAINLHPHFHSVIPDGLFVAGRDKRLAFVGLPPPADELRFAEEDHEERRGALRAKVAGFSLHAARCVAPWDREGLERLCRYGLRAPFSQERLTLLEDGRVVYALRRPWPNAAGVRRLVMEPRELLARLAALVPASGLQMIRYHGVFANRSKLRSCLPAPPPRPVPEGVAPAEEAGSGEASQAGGGPGKERSRGAGGEPRLEDLAA